MSEIEILNPPRTLIEIWESLPEGTLCQIINNTLVMSPAPVDDHQKILGKLFSKILIFAEENNLGEVRISPYDVHLDDENIFQPDMFFISESNAQKINKHLYGAPDLVIEILSPSNRGYDTNDKKDIYEKFGVKELFIVEPSDKSVISYLMVNDEFVQRDTKSGVIESVLLGASFTF